MKAMGKVILAIVLAVLAAAGCRTTVSPDREKMAQGQFQRAVRLAQAGKPDRAIMALKTGLEEDPEHLPSRLLLAGLLRESGDTPGALAEYHTALTLVEDQKTNRNDRIMILGNRGDCFLSLERYEEAVRDFSTALELKPEEKPLQFKRGEAYLGLRDYSRALADFDQVALAYPQEPTVWMRRGDCHMAATNYSAAADDYTAALERNPKDPALFARRAAVFTAIGEDELALADYSRAVDLEPESALRWYDRAVTSLTLEQPKPALADLNEALKRDPKRSEIFNARGMAYEMLGDDARALADYGKARALDPRYAPAEVNRTRLLERVGAARPGEKIRQ